VSIRATGCWELGEVRRAWLADGVVGVSALVNAGRAGEGSDDQAAEPVRRRVLVHASGFRQSPYADIKPAGTDGARPPAKLWHSSPGSSGW
jgi:error-prone DNA polymerase